MVFFHEMFFLVQIQMLWIVAFFHVYDHYVQLLLRYKATLSSKRLNKTSCLAHIVIHVTDLKRMKSLMQILPLTKTDLYIIGINS